MPTAAGKSLTPMSCNATRPPGNSSGRCFVYILAFIETADFTQKFHFISVDHIEHGSEVMVSISLFHRQFEGFIACCGTGQRLAESIS